MKRLSILVFLLLVASLKVSCTGPAASPAPNSSMLQPGNTLGDAVLKIAKDETAEPDIFTYCNPLIAESDPRVMVRTCNVPQLPYLFIGYGELANTQQELGTLWKAESWQLYFDEHAVDLQSFGAFDTDWEGYRLRRWKIAVENLPPGEHSLLYISSTADSQELLKDITWVFTVGESASISSPSLEKILYPNLSSETVTGQHPYTSEKSGLNFWLYLPARYGRDARQKWPLIVDLHGGGGRGSNLDTLLISGLPKKLQTVTDFPFIVVSPQGSGEYEVWSKDEMINSLFVLLDEIQAKYSVDSQRIYLTGVSVGGEGVWEIGLQNPDHFAALVPVMGYYDYPFNVPANICDLKNVPIWAFHGDQDKVVSLEAEESLVKALQACGGNAQLTIFPNAGHDIENEVYANLELYQWMLSQTLK